MLALTSFRQPVSFRSGWRLPCQPGIALSRHVCWRDVVEGLRYVMKGRRIFIFLTITASMYTFATSAFTTLFPVFARKLLDLGPVEVGYLWSMLGIGLLTVSLALTSSAPGA